MASFILLSVLRMPITREHSHLYQCHVSLSVQISSKSCVKVALRKNSSPMQQDTNNKTVQPTFGDVVTNHSYALLHQSPQCTRQQQHKSRSAGDTEPGVWQYTTPARSEDELISQLKELTVREISLDHIE